MPGFNQRGPMNEGPMTGRGMGQCNTAYSQGAETVANATWSAPGYGYGQGRGMGRRGCQRPRRGMGMRMGAGMTPQPPPLTKTSLAARARQLEAELEAIQTELKQMETE